MNIVNFILGGFVNICFVLVVLFLTYFMTLRGIAFGMAFGRELADDEVPGEVSVEVTVMIPDGATTEEIGGILEENGLVANKYIFWFQSRLNGTYKLFKPGEYKLDLAMTTGEIMQKLQEEQFTEQSYLTITIAEGLTLRQIGTLAESKGYFTADEFVEACENFEGDYSFIVGIEGRTNKLEGYLFPDTYWLPENPEPIDLIVRMLNRFEEVINNYRHQITELGFTIDEVITMASIIEKEVVRPSERGLVSSIIFNRMEADMPLQMCSTIMYILDKRKDRLLESDLQVVSPYNTYTNNGLPIGPICNPGRASIEAVINPSDTDYLYFVVKDEETGEHIFTSDYEEFLHAKELYNQRF